MGLVDINNNPVEDSLNPAGYYSASTQDFIEKSRFLCSCGLSQKLPFCDGTHMRANTPYKPIECKIVGDKILIRPKKELVLLQQKVENERLIQNSRRYWRVGAVLLSLTPILYILFKNTRQ